VIKASRHQGSKASRHRGIGASRHQGIKAPLAANKSGGARLSHETLRGEDKAEGNHLQSYLGLWDMDQVECC
jgi:hypothetical protein